MTNAMPYSVDVIQTPNGEQQTIYTHSPDTRVIGSVEELYTGGSFPVHDSLCKGVFFKPWGCMTMDANAVEKELIRKHPKAVWLIKEFMGHRDWRTNKVDLRHSPVDSYTKRVILDSYKILKDHRIIVRVRNKEYLFNPMYVLPAKKNLVEVKNEWDFLINK